MGILAGAAANGPYAITYNGLFSTNSTSFTSSSFSIGPAYADRIILIGTMSANTGSPTLTVGGVSATLLTWDTTIGWSQAIDVPGSTMTFTGTIANNATFFVFTVTGLSAGKAATFNPKTGRNNNSNSVSVSYSSAEVAVGDIFLAVGSKPATGSTDSWTNFGGTAGVTNVVQAGIGTGIGVDGHGAYGISPAVSSVASKTVTGSGTDSSKPINISVLKIGL